MTEYGNRQQQNFSQNHPKSPLWILAKKSCRRLAEEGCNRTIDAEGEIATDKKWTMNEMPQSAASPQRHESNMDQVLVGIKPFPLMTKHPWLPNRSLETLLIPPGQQRTTEFCCHFAQTFDSFQKLILSTTTTSPLLRPRDLPDQHKRWKIREIQLKSTTCLFRPKTNTFATRNNPYFFWHKMYMRILHIT